MKTIILLITLTLSSCCLGGYDTMRCDPMPKWTAYHLVIRN